MAYGIHILPVIVNDTRDAIDLVISISEGKNAGDTHQYGPVLSADDIAIIRDIMESDHPKRFLQDRVVWNILDLMRVIPNMFVHNIEEVQESDFADKVYHVHTDTEGRRAWSAEYAQHHAAGTSVFTPHERVPIRKLVSPPLTSSSHRNLYMNMCRKYMEAVTLFRLKWLEVQNEYTQVMGYTLHKLKVETCKAEDATAADATAASLSSELDEGIEYCTVFKMVLTEWSSHIRDGTVLLVDYGGESMVPVDIVPNSSNNTIRLYVDGDVEAEDLSNFIITRGNEALSEINEHIFSGPAYPGIEPT